MKTSVVAYFVVVCFALTGSALLAKNAVAQAPAPSAPIVVGKLKGEKHPELRKAMHALMNAQKFLQSAADDFGGHKASAITATNNALAEVKAALAYDKK